MLDVFYDSLTEFLWFSSLNSAFAVGNVSVFDLDIRE
jgi:hypothetical protein